MENPKEDPTLGETAFSWMLIFDMVFYSLVLLFAGYMIYKHLIMEKRYEISYLVAFYALTVVLTVSKISYFIVVYRTPETTFQICLWDILAGIGSHTKL